MALILFLIFSIRNLSELFLKPKQKTKVVDGKFSVILITLFFIIIGSSSVYYIYIDNSYSLLLFIIGMSLFMTGFILRIFTMKNMKESYSMAITPNENAVLITNGINSYIRHPLYLFYIIESIGLFVIKVNLISVVALFGMIITMYFRIKLEEIALVKKFGNDYLNYQKKTKCIIPFFY